MSNYILLRTDLLHLVPLETQAQIIQHRTSLSQLQGRRIIESIQTFEALLDELERQLLVNPRTGDIIQLRNILSKFCPFSMNVQTLVSEFQSKIRTEGQANPSMPGGSGPGPAQRPAPPQTLSFKSQEEQSKESLLMTSQRPTNSQPSLPLGPRGATSYQPFLSQGSRGPNTQSYNPSFNSPRSKTSQAITIPSSTRTRRISTPTTPTTPTLSTWSSSTSPSLQQRRLPRVIPGHVIDLIASRFDLMGGRDWQVFVEGLGINLSEYDRVRLLTGEVERSEREFSSLRDRLQFLFQLFQSKLTSNGLDTDITEIIVDTLRSTTVWGEPVFNALARQVTEALK